jgi:uncharacterized protein YdeI (YjbR/CyaY-like superfamily)
VNKETAARLIASGEMTAMGLAAVAAAKACGEWERAYTVRPATPVPDDLKQALKASPQAKANVQRVSRTRWDAWLAWLATAEGRARSRRRNMIVRALEQRDWAAVDAAARRVQN